MLSRMKTPEYPRDNAFEAAWWCRGPHAQTIWSALLRQAPRLTLTRARWELPDGDFLDADEMEAAAEAPRVIVLHGLESSSDSIHVLTVLQEALRRGWGGVAVNFRSCSGELNRLPRSYHGGETGDLAWVVAKVVAQYPASPIGLVGISLGGNVVLKYLGEQGDALPVSVRAAAALSAPVDLAMSARTLEQGLSRVYMDRLVARLKRKTLLKLSRYPDLVDRQALSAVRTIGEFDELVTAPVHGFASAEAYWRASSSLAYLPRIRRPTLLINAQDDPFLPAAALPRRQVSENAMLAAEFPARGGHVGFLEGRWPGHAVPWAEARAVQFLEELLH